MRINIQPIRLIPKLVKSVFSVARLSYIISRKRLEGRTIYLYEVYGGRIGHLLLNTENAYLAACRQQGLSGRPFMVCISFSKCCNEYALRMLKRSTLDEFVWLTPGISSLIIASIVKITEISDWLVYLNWDQIASIKEDDVYNRISPHTLSEQDTRDRRLLQFELGISPGKYISVHNRDNLYVEKNTNDPNCHDYRDYDISDMEEVIKYTQSKGMHLIRHGTVQKVIENPQLKRNIIDMSNRKTGYRDDFLLISECRFFIGCTTGFTQIARIFRKPLLLINQIPCNIFELTTRYQTTESQYNMVMPKLLREKKSGRMLSFKEIIEFEPSIHSKDCPYKEHGLEVINNSPSEIRKAAVEMDLRLSGKITKDYSSNINRKNLIRIIQGIPKYRDILERDFYIPDSFLNKYDYLVRES